VKKKYTGLLNIDGMSPKEKLSALIAGWMLPAIEARDEETFLRRKRVTMVAVTLLMWRKVPEKKRKRASASGMKGLASKKVEAAMRWLRDEATPLEQSELAEMLAKGCGAFTKSDMPNKWHLAALLSWIHARMEKGKDWKFQKVVEKYQTLREQNHWNDLPDIWRDSKTGNGSDWPLRRVLIDLGILPKKRTR
jgi:hypothetical protein